MSLPLEEQRAQSAHAFKLFRGEGPVRVTPEKLSAFLEDTREVEQPPANRLRWLAIQLENARFEHGWSDLRALYQAAAALDPTDYRVLHSWGASAVEGVNDSPDLSERITIANEAERVLLTALEMAPQTGPIAYTLGLLHYNHPARKDDPARYQARAIDWFTLAVEWAPERVIAQLYLAHCFHDRQDWPRAISEYEKVDLERLARDWPAWRAVKCREQLAHCHAYAGHTDEAVRRFTAFLDEVALWDEEQVEENVINVDEMVDAVTHQLDHPELLRRVRELVRRLGLEKHYSQLTQS